MKKIIFLLIYYLIAKNLPNYSFPGGKFYNWFRIKCLKNIIKIGNKCRIMKNVYIGNGNDIEIGDRVLIARDSIVLGKMHEFSDIKSYIVEQGGKRVEPTIIEDDVWFGIRVIIMPGLKLSKGSIIGAGAVVTKNTQPNGIYGGIPAKLIRKRD